MVIILSDTNNNNNMDRPWGEGGGFSSPTLNELMNT